jgi:hypothetical protein
MSISRYVGSLPLPNAAQRADSILLRLYLSQIMYTSVAPSRSNHKSTIIEQNAFIVIVISFH